MKNNIDSLTKKLEFIDKQLIALENKQIVLQDSISQLHKTLERSNIKSEFFSDQLSFQLFWFSLILAIVGLVSWSAIVTPIRKRLLKIEKDIVPNAVKDASDKIESKLTDFEERFHEISYNASEGISWGLKSLKVFFMRENDFMSAFLFGLRHVNLYFLDGIVKENENRIITDLQELEEFVLNQNIRLSQFKEYSEEVVTMLKRVKTETDINEICDFGFTIMQLLEKQPETSFDADENFEDQS